MDYKRDVTIDISREKNTEELQFRFQKELGLPGYYGKNWDSFWDCLSDGTIFREREIRRLKIVGIGPYAKACPRDAKILRKIVADYNAVFKPEVHDDGVLYAGNGTCDDSAPRDGNTVHDDSALRTDTNSVQCNVVDISSRLQKCDDTGSDFTARGNRALKPGSESTNNDRILLYEKRPCVYFTRHGQTVWNVENKICGATDIRLTELGHKQAEDLGEMLKKDPHDIDEILYSPLVRAADTARHISEMTGIPANCEHRLKEQNFGRFESTPRDGDEFLYAKREFINHFDGGESMLFLAQRIYNLLDDIKRESCDKTYLLVAHNGIARVVRSYFQDMTNDEFASFGMKNCELVRYDFDV